MSLVFLATWAQFLKTGLQASLSTVMLIFNMLWNVEKFGRTGGILMLSQQSKRAREEGRVLSCSVLPGKITEMLSQCEIYKTVSIKFMPRNTA